MINACNKPSNFKFLYDLQLPLEEKMSIIAKEMYGAGKVVLTPEVQETLERYSKQVSNKKIAFMLKTFMQLYLGLWKSAYMYGKNVTFFNRRS